MKKQQPDLNNNGFCEDDFVGIEKYFIECNDHNHKSAKPSEVSGNNMYSIVKTGKFNFGTEYSNVELDSYTNSLVSDALSVKNNYNYYKSGIYLSFNNSMHNQYEYNVKVEVWNNKLNQYQIIGDTITIGTKYYEWYIVFGGPCCDCQNTSGFNYLLKRIE